jgi:hypothetical protein
VGDELDLYGEGEEREKERGVVGWWFVEEWGYRGFRRGRAVNNVGLESRCGDAWRGEECWKLLAINRPFG